MSQSDRASGRVRDLREDVLSRLRGHTSLTDRLEKVGSIDDGAAVIMPSPNLDMQHRDSGTEPPAVAIAVSVVTGSSTRENHQERKNMVVQTDLQIRDGTLKAQGLAWHDELLDEIAAVLTTQVAGWHAGGESGGSPEPLWDEERNRYRSVQRFDLIEWS